MTVRNNETSDVMTRILIVDDDDDVRESLKAVLELDEHYVVDMASDAFMAKRILDTHKPDIALLDINLGNSSGLELVPLLKKHVPQMICIMMTAHRDVSYAVKAIQFGADEYILKPIDPERLLGLLKNFCALQKIERKKIDNNEKLQTIIGQTSGFIFLLNVDGELVMATDKALEFAGLSNETVIGQKFTATPWWKQSSKYKKNINNSIASVKKGQVVRFDAELFDHERKSVWFDLLFKPLKDNAGNVTMIMVEGHDISDYKKNQTRLEQKAYFDELTGLANRTLLEKTISKAISFSARRKESFAVMFVDLDHFKELNDVCGHQVGDELLKKVAKQLRKCVREEDEIARLGGDEFVAVLTSVKTQAEAGIVAARLNQSILELSQEDEQLVRISASIGVAFYPDDGKNMETLIDRADKAMYAAKQGGKNQFVVLNSVHSDNKKVENKSGSNILDTHGQQTYVLIVDDDVDVLSSLKDLIEIENELYVVKTATNAQQAKMLAFEFKPDIALLDIKLGQDNGLELVPWLKEKMPDVVCIMMTAYREADYAVTAVRFGADDYLYKPVDTNKLFLSLEQASEHQKLKRARDTIERRFRAVFEQTFQWLLLLDKQGVLLDANQVALNFAGINIDDVAGKVLWDTPWWNQSPPSKQRIKKILDRAKQGDFIREEMDLSNSRGDDITLDVSIKTIQDGHDQIDLIVVECRDITERKKAEDLVIEARDSLEQRVKDRTKELMRSLEHSKQARKEAEEANQLKTHFLGRMSHELRTPMNAILGFAQLLESDGLSETQAEYLHEISQAGHHLMDLINEVLDLSKIESGHLDIDMEYIPLSDIVSDSLAMVSPMAEEKNIQLVSQLKSPETCLLYVDRLRCKEVLINLLSNAVKYSHTGGCVEISGQMLRDDTMHITITDDGPGLSLEQQKLVFEPFTRLGAEYSDIEGTGIGLTIAKQLMERMKGRIGVQSLTGHGCTFWIECHAIQSDVQLKPKKMTELRSVASSGGTQHTVLYIEDNTANVRLVQNAFKRLPYIRLYIAPNAELGIEIANSKQPDLILLDINLPGMDGYAALPLLKQLPGNEKTPIVALSAAAMPKDIERGMRAGFKHYITKPVQVADLLDLVRKELAIMPVQPRQKA